MTFDYKSFLRYKVQPAFYTAAFVCLGVWLMKGCENGNGSASETNAMVKEIKADLDTIKNEARLDADTLKVYAKSTHNVVTRTEKKVDSVQSTVDRIWDRVDCALPPCGNEPVVPSRKVPVRKDPVPVKPVQPRDTVPNVIPVDTVPQVVPVKKQDTVVRTTVIFMCCKKTNTK